MHMANFVQTWFILIVTLGPAITLLQNGSLHQKIKAEALIWNLFVNSGLWDKDVLRAYKCLPREAWTSSKLTNSHLRCTSHSQACAATVLSLRELKLSCRKGTRLTWMSIRVWRLGVRRRVWGQHLCGLPEAAMVLFFHGSFNNFLSQWKLQLQLTEALMQLRICTLKVSKLSSVTWWFDSTFTINVKNNYHIKLLTVCQCWKTK